MNAKVIATKGKLSGKEFPLTPAKGMALAAPGGKRVEIRFDAKSTAYSLLSKGYPVSLNGEELEQAVLKDGDSFLMGGNEFKFEVEQAVKKHAELKKDDGTEELDPVEEEPAGDSTSAVSSSEARKKAVEALKSMEKPGERKKVHTHDETEELDVSDDDKDEGNDTGQENKPDTGPAGRRHKDTRLDAMLFCDSCGVPLVGNAFETGEAVEVDGSFFCKDCHGEPMIPVSDRKQSEKTSKDKEQKSGSGRKKTSGSRKQVPRRSRGGGRRGSRAARLMRQRSRKKTPAAVSETSKKEKDRKPVPAEKSSRDDGTEALDTPPEGSDKKKKLKTAPEKPAQAGSEPKPVSEQNVAEAVPVEPPKTGKKSKTDDIKPAKFPEVDEKGDTDGVEPVKPAVSLPEKRAASSRRERPSKPKGPGAGAKTGKALAAVGKGIVLLFKYTGIAFAAIFIFIIKRIKIFRLKNRMKKQLGSIGSIVREKRHTTAFISEELSETAWKARDVSEDSAEKEALLKELGEKFLEEYSKMNNPDGIMDMVEEVDMLQQQIEQVRNPGKPEKNQGTAATDCTDNTD